MTNPNKKQHPLDTLFQIEYDNGTTTSSSGYPHPLSCVFFMPCACHLYVYDGSREPNTIPPVGNKLRRLDAVVEARRPMPTKLCATSTSTNHREKTMKALVFNGVTLTPVHYNSQIYLTSAELAKALGYARTDKVTELYNRNADEFSDGMTMTLKMGVNGINGSTRQLENRIFSLRGCHLIAMFARTPVAKDFRKWVLDILDKEVGEPVMTAATPTSPILSPADYAVIKRAIHLIAHELCYSGQVKSAIYARLRTLCEVDSVTQFRYEHLPTIQNEIYRIERTLSPYKKMRSETEKQLIRRICGEDEFAVSQAILDIEKTTHEYEMAFDARFSELVKASQITSLVGE